MNGVPKTPEFIITTTDEPEQREAQFSDLYALKDKIASIMLLWDFNSYYINIQQGYFIINGGRRIQPTVASLMLHKKLEYARRNRMDVQIAGDDEKENPEISISYIFGMHGVSGDEEKSILLHISSDGTTWCWRDTK
jgi:hypothetical protein